jgi:hypothetical protein
MTSLSSLESFPPEILEQIVTPVHQHVRPVSRTFRAATQRRLEQLCRSPINPTEFYRNFLQEHPLNFILFPKLDDVLRDITKLNFVTLNINTYYPQTEVNHTSVTSKVAVVRNDEYVGIRANFRLTHPEAIRFSNIDTGWVRTRELDLLTQWRILVLREGCPDVETIARNYLIAKLEQMRQFVDEVSSEWFAQENDRSKSDAILLVLYFHVYVFFNAQMLNVWPLSHDRESISWAFDLAGYNGQELNYLWTDINIFYSRVIRAIQRLETM